jgi:hypothetical protein
VAAEKWMGVVVVVAEGWIGLDENEVKGIR